MWYTPFLLSLWAFLLSLFWLFWAVYQRKMRWLWIGLLSLFFSGVLALWGVYKGGKKVLKKVEQAYAPRTGLEVYQALFGKASLPCVQVLNYQDQIVPKIDYGIFLQVKTCPQECARILAKQSYEKTKIATERSYRVTAHTSWFQVRDLGDSIVEYKHKNGDGGNGQWIYLNRDSTIMLVADIMD